MRKESAGEERGALLLEAALAAAIVAGLAVFTGQILLRYHDGLREEASARYIERVWRAAQDYAAEDAAFRDGAGIAMSGAPGQIGAAIGVPALRTAGHLPASFPARDPFGAEPEIVFSSFAPVPVADPATTPTPTARMLQAAVLMRNAAAPWGRERAGRIISLVTPRISGPAGHVRAGDTATFPGGTAMAVPGAQAGDIVALAALPLVSGLSEGAPPQRRVEIVDVTPDFSGGFSRGDLARALGNAIQSEISDWRAEKIRDLTAQDFRAANQGRDLTLQKATPSSDRGLESFLQSYAGDQDWAREVIENAEIIDVPVHECPSKGAAAWTGLQATHHYGSSGAQGPVTLRTQEGEFRLTQGYISPNVNVPAHTAVWLSRVGEDTFGTGQNRYRSGGPGLSPHQGAGIQGGIERPRSGQISASATGAIWPERAYGWAAGLNHNFQYVFSGNAILSQRLKGLAALSRVYTNPEEGHEFSLRVNPDLQAWRFSNLPRSRGGNLDVPSRQVEIRELASVLPRGDDGNPQASFLRAPPIGGWGDGADWQKFMVRTVTRTFSSDAAAGHYIHRPGACNHGLPLDLNTRQMLRPCSWTPKEAVRWVERSCAPETRDIYNGLAVRLKRNERAGTFDRARSLSDSRPGN